MLKKLSLLALMAVAVFMPAAAQFRYGPQIGGNLSTFHFRQEGLVEASQSFNPHAMLNCEFIFTHFGLGIDFGLGYTMTGGIVTLDKPIWAVNGFGRERVMIHNIMIPVHLRYKCTQLQGVENIIAPIVYAGPEFNIQVGHSRHERNGQKAFQFSGGDVALACGIGVELIKCIQITVGYTSSVTYAMRTAQLEDFTAVTQGWTFRVGYLF